MTNFSILATIAMNLYRFLGFFSITTGQRWLSQRLWSLHVSFPKEDKIARVKGGKNIDSKSDGILTVSRRHKNT